MKKAHPQVEQLKITLRHFGAEFVEEYRFHPVRMWRFDLAIVDRKIAIEYHGHSGFIGGKASGHSTIKGLSNDCEKLTQAMLLGWRMLAFTALHFRESERQKHKLQNPYEVLKTILAQ
jgi:hypothetical protein